MNLESPECFENNGEYIFFTFKASSKIMLILLHYVLTNYVTMYDCLIFVMHVMSCKYIIVYGKNNNPGKSDPFPHCNQ